MARKTIATMNKLAAAGKLDAAMVKKPSNAGTAEIDIAKIAPDPDQPRKTFDQAALKELTNNIIEHGVLQPIVVQPANADGVHIIIMGERRYRAATQAGLGTIPALVKEATPELRAIQLSENIQRQELTTMEIALAVEQMKTDGRSRKDIAKALGWSEPQISHFSAILKMEPKLQALAEKSVQVRALNDLQKLWSKDQSAVENFIDAKEPEELTRVAVEELKTEIGRKNEPAGQGDEPESSDNAAALTESVTKPTKAENGPKGQIVFFCKQGDDIGRLMTDQAASSGKAVMVSFDNGDRIEEILLSDINLVEAVEV